MQQLQRVGMRRAVHVKPTCPLAATGDTATYVNLCAKIKLSVCLSGEEREPVRR